MEPTNQNINSTLGNEEVVNVPESESEKAPIIDMEASDEDFLGQLQSIDYTEEQYSFTQEQVDKIVLRLLKAVERRVENETREEDLTDREYLFDHRLQSIFFGKYSRLFTPNQRKKDRENIQDQVLLAVTNLALSGEHMRSCAAFLNSSVLQQSHMIRPSVMFNVGERLTWYQNPDFSEAEQRTVDYIDQELMNSINYDINYGGGYFQTWLAEKFEKSDSPVEQLKILEFGKKCFFSLNAEGYNVKEEQLELLQGLASKIYNESDNYLVKNRAEMAVGEMSRADPDYGISPYQEEFRYWQERQNLDFIASTRDQERELMKLYIGDNYQEGKHNQQRKMLIMNRNFRAQLQEIQSQNKYDGKLCVDLSPGNIGIYDTAGNLQKIHKTESDEDVSIAELPILGEKESDNYDQLKEFSILLSLPMRHVVERDFGVDLSELDFTTQFYFLKYLEKSSSMEALALSRFTKEYGKDGFRVFLSLNGDKKVDKAILNMDVNYGGTEVPKMIFSKYSEIIDQTEKVRDYLRGNYKNDKDYDEEIVDTIVQNLLQRGKQLLNAYSNRVDDPDLIINDLESISADVALFADSIKGLKQKGRKIDLESFQDTSIESFAGGEAAALERNSDVEEMLRLTTRNWQGSKLREGVITGLKNAFASEKSNFYLVRHQGKILGFLRLDDDSKDKLHFASFNVASDLHNSGLGTEFLKTIFLDKTKDIEVEAEADPNSPITSKYIHDFGFVVSDLVEYGDNKNVVFKINKNEENSKYVNSHKKYHELMIECGGADVNIGGSLFYNYKFPSQYDQFLKNAQSLLHDGRYVITAYASEVDKDEKNNFNYIVVFEPKKIKNQSIERQEEYLKAS